LYNPQKLASVVSWRAMLLRLLDRCPACLVGGFDIRSDLL
jgi:hypothetical protein